MTNHQIQELIAQIQVGAVANVRNLAAAEDAVQKGQFNIAKILRAATHTQRILAMEAARLMAGKTDKTNLLEVISKELKNSESSNIFEALSKVLTTKLILFGCSTIMFNIFNSRFIGSLLADHSY